MASADRGADEVEAVQGRLGGDARGVARDLQAGVVDGQVEVLGNLVLVDHLAHAHADGGGAGEFASGHPRLVRSRTRR
jgi:hypothetical protein